MLMLLLALLAANSSNARLSVSNWWRRWGYVLSISVCVLTEFIIAVADIPGRADVWTGLSECMGYC